MILHQQKIPGTTTNITIAPLGDIQWAGDRNDLAYDHLEEHIQMVLSLPNPYFVGMGDYIDFASPSNRDALRTAKLYDTARKVIADATRNLADDLFERLLRPTSGKWLGLVNGHHHHPINDGRDSDVYLAERLQAPFLDELGIVQLQWEGGGTVNVLVYHGSGSSVFPWGPLNRLYRLSPSFNADILLMGHQTKKAVGEYDFIDPVFPDGSSPRLEHRTRHLVGTGGWTKGYVDGRKTYVSSGALNPVALGQPLIHIRPRVRVNSQGVSIWEPGITVET